jgi:hypothetical protein
MKYSIAALILPLLAAGPAAPEAQSPSAAQQPAAYVYNGTVQTVRSDPGTVDVITGVGEALRMVHMNVVSTTTIEAAGRRLTLGELKPGDVIHAECRLTAQGMVADKIERVPPGGSPRGDTKP